MGIKGLTPLLKRFAPSSLVVQPISHLQGKSVAFDMSIFIYKIYLAKQTIHGDPVHNYKNFLGFISNTGVDPVLVFDGNVRSADKAGELLKRKKLRVQAKEEYTLMTAQNKRLNVLQKLTLSLNMSLLSSRNIEDFSARDPKSTWNAIEKLQKQHKPYYIPISNIEECYLTVTESLIYKENSAYKALSSFFEHYSVLESKSARASYSQIQNLRGKMKDLRQEIVGLAQKSSERLCILKPRAESKLGDPDTNHIEIARNMGFDCRISEGIEAEKYCAKISSHTRITDRIEASITLPPSNSDTTTNNKNLSTGSEYLNVDGLFATVSEDLDVLPFGGKKLLRLFTTDCENVLEIDREVAQEELDLTYRQFVDLCILCGTDFTGTIPKVGPITALQLIKSYKDIESVMASPKFISKPQICSNVNYDLARRIFLNSDDTNLPPTC